MAYVSVLDRLRYFGHGCRRLQRRVLDGRLLRVARVNLHSVLLLKV